MDTAELKDPVKIPFGQPSLQHLRHCPARCHPGLPVRRIREDHGRGLGVDLGDFRIRLGGEEPVEIIGGPATLERSAIGPVRNSESCKPRWALICRLEQGIALSLAGRFGKRGKWHRTAVWAGLQSTVKEKSRGRSEIQSPLIATVSDSGFHTIFPETTGAYSYLKGTALWTFLADTLNSIARD
ncbi:hypothetical protein [Pseudooceanicola algae]|uniref:hypothetical protein n=1 Tax=Pseudooceanicola algae TaxID=1537215 RepID=UPI0011C3B39E|nr:hypothetical protein [Pseudooceanicola algae]